ncbi:MAG: SAM-dependent methyltransferase [Clostridia bacterium]|nr:SAM-dependent methyltransferase [Clostridia bacterium]
MREKELSRRLHAAFLLVREGRTVADIGTDHAYLPITLVKSGKTDFAYASDIGKGPLARAEENIKKAGLNEKIKTVLTDGAAVFDTLADEFIIAGMGGELIFDIISRAPFMKNPDIHLVLQPMTKVPALRRLLAENGFNIEKETLVSEDGKVYTLMSVYFDGKKRELTDYEAVVGDVENADKELLMKILEGVIYDLDKKIKGKNAPEDVALKEKIEALIKTKRFAQYTKCNE